MTRPEAEKLIQIVEREEPRIVATMEPNNRDNRGNGWRVKLELKVQTEEVRLHQVMHINDKEDWESVKQAWSHWLPGLDVEQERIAAHQKRVYYLVDGIPMCFYQDKRGDYWIGTYRRNGKAVKRYFGIVDPRPRYKVIEHQKEYCKKEKVG